MEHVTGVELVRICVMHAMWSKKNNKIQDNPGKPVSEAKVQNTAARQASR